MNVKLINRGATGEFMFDGRLDTNSANDVQSLVGEAALRFSDVILNLNALQYISSNGLRVIKTLYANTCKRGAKMHIINVPRQVMEVFEMTGFAQILPIE